MPGDDGYLHIGDKVPAVSTPVGPVAISSLTGADGTLEHNVPGDGERSPLFGRVPLVVNKALMLANMVQISVEDDEIHPFDRADYHLQIWIKGGAQCTLRFHLVPLCNNAPGLTPRVSVTIHGPTDPDGQVGPLVGTFPVVGLVLGLKPGHYRADFEISGGSSDVTASFVVSPRVAQIDHACPAGETVDVTVAVVSYSRQYVFHLVDENGVPFAGLVTQVADASNPDGGFGPVTDGPITDTFGLFVTTFVFDGGDLHSLTFTIKYHITALGPPVVFGRTAVVTVLVGSSYCDQFISRNVNLVVPGANT